MCCECGDGVLNYFLCNFAKNCAVALCHVWTNLDLFYVEGC